MTAKVKNKVYRMQTVVPVIREKKIYPHVNIVFGNVQELRDFDNAIAEERKSTGLRSINRSKIIRKLVRKWVNYEVTV